MHPLTYDIAIKRQQLEVERAIRTHASYEGAWPGPVASAPAPRRIEDLWRRLKEVVAPPRLQPAQAD